MARWLKPRPAKVRIVLTKNVGWAEQFYRDAQQTQTTKPVFEVWVCWVSQRPLNPTYMTEAPVSFGAITIALHRLYRAAIMERQRLLDNKRFKKRVGNSLFVSRVDDFVDGVSNLLQQRLFPFKSRNLTGLFAAEQ